MDRGRNKWPTLSDWAPENIRCAKCRHPVDDNPEIAGHMLSEIADATTGAQQQSPTAGAVLEADEQRPHPPITDEADSPQPNQPGCCRMCWEMHMHLNNFIEALASAIKYCPDEQGTHPPSVAQFAAEKSNGRMD